MKLRELLELQNPTEINNVITIYEGESCHIFISDEDYENFDLDRFGDAEILYFTAAAIDVDDEVHTILPYLSIHALLEEPPNECSNGAGLNSRERERPMTKYKFTWHNAETNIESGGSYDTDTLVDALATACVFRKDKEYVYITNTETDETFVTYDGVEFSVVPEV